MPNVLRENHYQYGQCVTDTSGFDEVRTKHLMDCGRDFGGLVPLVKRLFLTKFVPRHHDNVGEWREKR